MGNPLSTEHSHWIMFKYSQEFIHLTISPLLSLASVDQQKTLIFLKKNSSGVTYGNIRSFHHSINVKVISRQLNFKKVFQMESISLLLYAYIIGLNPLFSFVSDSCGILTVAYLVFIKNFCVNCYAHFYQKGLYEFIEPLKEN